MAFRYLKHTRRIHKWLMLIVGIQFLFWTAGGLYFSLFDIHDIHGEGLVNKPDHIKMELVHYDSQRLLADFPNARNIKLYALDNTPHWQFSIETALGEKQKTVINATTGEFRETISEQEVRHLATKAFSGDTEIKKVTLISEQTPTPFELSRRHLPVWQVSFEGLQYPTLYISLVTGEVVTKRHVWWRTFDVFWRLHIVDPLDGANVQNPFLTLLGAIALVTTLAGLILTLLLVLAPLFRKRALGRHV